MKLSAVVLAGCLLGPPVIGQCQAPTPVKGILAAQRFELAEPYEDTWSLDKAQVSAGMLLVLDVDPKLVTRRESLEPLLYVGGKPTRRLNHGDISGHVLVIVPVSTDLEHTLMWLGKPDLPEALTAEKIQAEKLNAERALATRAGVGTQSARGLPRAERPTVQARDLAALLRDVAAPLIDEFSRKTAKSP